MSFVSAFQVLCCIRVCTSSSWFVACVDKDKLKILFTSLIQKKSNGPFLLFGKREELRVKHLDTLIWPFISPEKDSPSIAWITDGKISEFIKKSHNVFPPKGSNWTPSLWWCLRIGVEFGPCHGDPGYICLVVKIVQNFMTKALFWLLMSIIPSPPWFFGLQAVSQAARQVSLLLMSP